MSDELKTCPFCGEEATLEDWGTKHKSSWVASCPKCYNVAIIGETKEESAALWNRRVEDARIKELEAKNNSVVKLWVEAATLRDIYSNRIAELESENAALKQQLSDAQSAIIRDGGDCDGCLGGNHAVIKKLESDNRTLSEIITKQNSEHEQKNKEVQKYISELRHQLVSVMPNLCEAAYVLLVAHDSDCNNYEGMGISASSAYNWLKQHGINTDRIDAILQEHGRSPELTIAWER